jgi:hypothetical protein
MTFTEEQIEWIVVEVLRRLGVAEGREAKHSASHPPTAAPIELVITERVVTMRSIEGRLHGIRRLIVPPRAVVTPALQDELKQRQIELVREGRT